MSESIRITEISWRRSYLCLEFEGPEGVWPVLAGKAGTFSFLPDEQAALYVTPREGCRYASLSLVNVEQGSMLPEGSYELRARQEQGGEELALTFAPALLMRVNEISKVFRYYNRYSYLAWFSLEEEAGAAETGRVLLHTEFAVRNENPGSRGRRRDFLSKGMQEIYDLARRTAKGHEKRILFFSETRDFMPGNFQAVYERMLARGMDKEYEIKVVLRNDVGKGASKMAKAKLLAMLARYDYIFVEDYVPLFTGIRPATEVRLIQLWHAGFGYKAVGYTRFGIKGSPHPYHSCHRHYTDAVVGNEGLKEIYAEVYGIDRTHIHATGMPRLSDFLDAQRIAAARERLATEYPQIKDRRVILFAPTYRGSNQKAADYRITEDDQKLLYELCRDTDAVILFKAHHFIDRRLALTPGVEDRILDLSGEAIEDLMYVSDLLITDYSSCFYDYLLLRRPVLFYLPDEEAFTAFRGVCCPVGSTVPGPVARTVPELCALLRQEELPLPKPQSFMLDNALTNGRYTAADRVLDAIFGEK
ncbi:MAG: CDP-glycerol glycerophosphotransferase family protein [Clostridia bacterium]|nr:CDP-glycerol glycerophosphotransferase family protein [Clostridia bacterium]